MKNKIILCLIAVILPYCAWAAESGKRVFVNEYIVDTTVYALEEYDHGFVEDKLRKEFQREKYKVVGDADIRARFSAEELKMALGSNNEESLKKIMSSGEVDYIVYGYIRYRDNYIGITAKMLDKSTGATKLGRVKTIRISKSILDESLYKKACTLLAEYIVSGKERAVIKFQEEMLEKEKRALKNVADALSELKDILEDSVSFDNVKSTVTYEEIANLVCRGGFPSVLNVKEEHRLKIAKDYYKSLCETDIKKYNNEKLNPILAKAVLKAYARNVHTVSTNKTIFDDIRNIYGDVSDPTIYNYINAFKRLFILEEIPAWNPNIRSKTVIQESPKKSFVDPSIAVAALESSPNELINDANTLGFLFENLVYRDLSVYAESI
ncbi:MAG: DUF4143 domain-containing protein, partial [Leptospirales bacterium]|nr:DUF4143 domain-containing protein [Leptospirales bacterium]